MAIDYEKWAADLLRSEEWRSTRVGSDEEIAYMASIGRKLAAEVTASNIQAIRSERTSPEQYLSDYDAIRVLESEIEAGR